MRASTRRGSVLHIALALSVTLGALYWSWIPSSTPAMSAARRAALRMGPVTKGEIEVALAKTGLTLKTVAAVGLNAQQVAAAIGDATEVITEDIEELRTASLAAAEARSEAERLSRVIRGGAATQQDRTAHSAALAAAQTAQSQAQAILAAAFTSASASLTASQIAALQTLQGNVAWQLPIHYLAANREQSEWVALRDALANVRVASQFGEDPDQGATDLIHAANSAPGVAAAAANLAGIGELTAAWNLAVTP